MHVVFVSSPGVGLERERVAVKAALERMRGTEFAGMELFGSRDENARKASLEEVDEADLYVGIIGGRYGSGITRAEYERARERGLDCLLYVQNDGAVTARDDDPAAARALEEWLAAITNPFHGHLVSRFSTPDELATLVAADVHSWLYRRLVLAGIADLPTDYAARIENFLDEYAGTPERPVPFGGRADVLAELDAWAEGDAAHPYLLLAALAGRGKSATLVHWTRRRIGDPSAELVFIPVSIRFRTNLAGVFFPALAARLARTHGDDVPTDVNLPAEVWRGMVADYLRTPLPGGRRLIVVLDGLDEAADWEAGADLFPRRAAAGVRIVVSTRLTADLPTPAAWLDQLGWDARVARTLALPSLTREGVRDVLESMGFPLAGLGEGIVRELHRLSEGDPLLIRLYAQELWSRGSEVARLGPGDLATIDPGLEGYFERWWREQKKLWGEASPLKERSVRAVLSLLAAAFGPLRREDLLAVAPPESELTTWTLDDALEPVRRFVIESEAGFVFSHPRFGHYMANELAAAERRAVDERFAAWSRAVREAMRGGTLPPAEAPPYVVQFSGAHLERLSAGADELCALLTPEWRTAREATEGGLAGFATDVSRAWRAARREDERLLAAGSPPAQLPAEVLCFLLHARIRSLERAIPASIIGRLVEEKVWSLRQAAAYARNMDASPRKVAALVEVARFARPAEQRKLMEEARAAGAAVTDTGSRVEVALSLLRAGDPLESFPELTNWDPDTSDVWLSAARALIETGRAAEVERLRKPAHGMPIARAVHCMIDHDLLDDAEALFRTDEEEVRYYDELQWRFALRGRDVATRNARPLPVARIRDLARQAAQGLPLELREEDARWIVSLLGVDSMLAEFDALIAAIAASVGGELRSALAAGIDPVGAARLGLRQEADALEWWRTSGDETGPYREYIWRNRLARIADRQEVEEGVEYAAERYMDTEELAFRVRTYLDRDADAFRRALARMGGGLGDAPRFVLAAAAFDVPFRDRHLSQFVRLYRSWPRSWSPVYDTLMRFFDRPSLLRIAEIFTRVDDTLWIDTMRFVFDPRPDALPSIAGKWQHSSKYLTEALIAAAALPDLGAGVLRQIILQTGEQTEWLTGVDSLAELLPAETAAEVRALLWTRFRKNPERLLGDIPQMVHAPPPGAADAWEGELPAASSAPERVRAEVGRILLLKSGRREAVEQLERSHPAADLATASLYHLADELSDRTIAALCELVLAREDSTTTRTLVAISRRLTAAQTAAVYQRAIGQRRPSTLAALLPALHGEQRSAAAAWLVSPEAMEDSIEDLIEVATYRPEVRPDLAAALEGVDVVAAFRALPSHESEQFFALFVGARLLPLSPAVARQLMGAALDPAAINATVEDSWFTLAGLRLFLLRSGDEALFPSVLAAIERAIQIFP